MIRRSMLSILVLRSVSQMSPYICQREKAVSYTHLHTRTSMLAQTHAHTVLVTRRHSGAHIHTSKYKHIFTHYSTVQMYYNS